MRCSQRYSGSTELTGGSNEQDKNRLAGCNARVARHYQLSNMRSPLGA